MPLPALALAGLALVLQRRSSFVPDPKYPWVVEGLNLAYRDGDLLGFPDVEFGGHRPASRYEYAIGIHASETRRLARLARLESFLAKPGDDVERAALVRGLGLLPFYRRADAEFRPELTALGVTPDDRLDRIASLTRRVVATSPRRTLPFRDVPFDHWAAKAVGDLRALGLLDGYPETRFRG